MITQPTPVKKRQMNFFLSQDVVGILNTFVPKGSQSQFVERSIESSLSALKFQDAMKKSFGSWKSRRESTGKFLRTLRSSSRHSR